MTFRAKPVVKRDHKPAWETQDRRNFYLNLGFGLIVFLAVLILAIAAGLSYYNSHLASVGSVDGESISKDEFPDRGDRRPPDRGPGHVAPVDHRPAAPVVAGDHPRATDRHQVPGEAGRSGRRHGCARRDR